MDQAFCDRLAAILPTASALIIVLATFFDWWNIGYNGEQDLKLWTKVMLGVVALALAAALFLQVRGCG